VWLNRKIFPQDAQKGCPARPQPKNRPQAYPLGYVEDLFKTRTKLAGFFQHPAIWRIPMADIQIDDGIIKILSLEVQDPKAAAVLAEYPQARWAEITRKAVKIGLGYLKGGERA
jgi:hypothetical protein